jgi:hypothetical protein
MQMKNCEPPLSGMLGASTPATATARHLLVVALESQLAAIPRCSYRALCAGSFDSGSPP